MWAEIIFDRGFDALVRDCQQRIVVDHGDRTSPLQMSALLVAKRWHVRIWLVRNKQEVINHLLPIFGQHGRVVCHSASILYGSCAFRVQAACLVSRLGFRAEFVLSFVLQNSPGAFHRLTVARNTA